VGRTRGVVAPVGVIPGLTALTVVLLAAPAAGEFQVNTYTTHTQLSPAVAAGADGTFVVVWASDRQTQDGWFCCFGYRHDLVGRRVSATGTPLGGEFLVSTYTLKDHGAPSAAAGAAGDFVVVWRRGTLEGPEGIFGRRFTASGDPLGDEFQVSASTRHTHYQPPAVAADAAGNFVVVWTQAATGPGPVGVRARRFDASGSPQSEEFVVSSTSTQRPFHAVVAMDAAGGFLVAWNSRHLNAAEYAIRARHYDAAGIATPAFPVSESTSVRTGNPTLAASGDHFVTAWSQPDGRLMGRRVAAAGPVGPTFEVTAHSTDAAVAGTPDGGFTVVWTGPDTADSSGVFGQRFGAAGEPDGARFRVNAYTTLGQAGPAIAAHADKSFLVAWTSGGPDPLGPSQDGNEAGVFAQPFRDALFADGFDSGGLAAWSGAATDGGDLRAVPRLDGEGHTFALAAWVDDTTALYVQDDSPQNEGRYRARFELDPRGFDPGEAGDRHRVRIFLAFEAEPARRVLAVVLRRRDGDYGLRAHVRLEDGEVAETPFIAIADAPHWIELDWSRATRPDAADGSLSLWIDGQLAGHLPGLDNPSSGVGFVRLGALAVKAGASGTLRWDEFTSRRFSAIGLGAN
jgi:hypothetical protein